MQVDTLNDNTRLDAIVTQLRQAGIGVIAGNTV